MKFPGLLARTKLVFGIITTMAFIRASWLRVKKLPMTYRFLDGQGVKTLQTSPSNDDNLFEESMQSSNVFSSKQNVLHSRYRSPLEDIPEGILTSALPVPIKVIEQYKSWHSVDALQRDPGLEHRKFAIGFYTCPMQAGNRMHHFMNGLLWAILTNRTLLWDYWDYETCDRYSTEKFICRSSNRVEDCNDILVRAEWIPSYDEWSMKLGLEQPVQLPFHATHPKFAHWLRYDPWNDGDEKLFGVDHRKKYPQQVVIFGESRFKINWLSNITLRDSILHTQQGRQICARLHERGVDFLYGMLFRYSFDFAEKLRSGLVVADTDHIGGSRQNGFSAQSTDKEKYMVALHSRHTHKNLDGCNVENEIKCLHEMINRTRFSRRHLDQCQPIIIQVNIMSDRDCTLKKLNSFLKTMNVTVAISSHDSGESFLEEHGPFAGVGFYQDLALVSQARSEFIGRSRSSSDLLLELIEFERTIYFWKHGGNVSTIAKLTKCKLI